MRELHGPAGGQAARSGLKRAFISNPCNNWKVMTTSQQQALRESSDKTGNTMFDQYNWQKVTGPQLDPFLKLVNPIQGKHNAAAASSTAEWCQLPFYSSIALVRI